MELINRVVDGVSGPLIGVHICRGNWSREEDVLLSGGYEDLMPHLKRMNVGMFSLEYATPRAGRLEAVGELRPGTKLGFGTVNPRTDAMEDVDWIVSRARFAAGILGADNILLNPDCGFGTFSDRPVASAEIASKKLATLAAAAKKLRG
ncbi:MAG: hypothetical protein L6Q71_10695 [Planctomycetes bacterium]|nr:hypothetical protein [Planctomycetota bacterium]